MLRALLHNWFHAPTTVGNPATRKSARARPFRPRLEGLESREVPASQLSGTFTGVDSGNNASGDTNFFQLPLISDDGRFVAFLSRESLDDRVNDNLDFLGNYYFGAKEAHSVGAAHAASLRAE